ncbi:MAG TPA: tRNA pseudouridine(38-40) synthase TruA [Thermoanaerobaculia bacterium]|nr:tRNA pseudouridine(38-40) synthase TruA [Thermoanaerobaculia bacterium]
MRLLFTLQYLGTRYAGWQAQANATAIQPLLEAALSRMYQATIRVEGAGRTDSGVHAAGQRAHADVPFEIPLRGLIRGLNDLLPSDIRILSAEPVPDTFHCRFAPHWKRYRYQIWNGPVADVFHSETHAHVGSELDERIMQQASEALVGTHDFKAFTVAEPEVSSTVRTVRALTVQRVGNVVAIDVSADGFLRYMVRRIAGSLIEVGRQKLDMDGVRRSLEPSFEPARWTAPAKGLMLVDVNY